MAGMCITGRGTSLAGIHLLVNEGYLECAVCGTIFRGWLSKYWAGIPERGKGEREGARQVLFGQLAVRGKVCHGCVVMDPRGFPDYASTWTPSVRSRVRLATGLLLSRTRHLSILYGASLTLVIGVLFPQGRSLAPMRRLSNLPAHASRPSTPSLTR